jgi:hypothetical protein
MPGVAARGPFLPPARSYRNASPPRAQCLRSAQHRRRRSRNSSSQLGWLGGAASSAGWVARLVRQCGAAWAAPRPLRPSMPSAAGRVRAGAGRVWRDARHGIFYFQLRGRGTARTRRGGAHGKISQTRRDYCAPPFVEPAAFKAPGGRLILAFTALPRVSSPHNDKMAAQVPAMRCTAQPRHRPPPRAAAHRNSIIRRLSAPPPPRAL